MCDGDGRVMRFFHREISDAGDGSL